MSGGATDKLCCILHALTDAVQTFYQYVIPELAVMSEGATDELCCIHRALTDGEDILPIICYSRIGVDVSRC